MSPPRRPAGDDLQVPRDLAHGRTPDLPFLADAGRPGPSGRLARGAGGLLLAAIALFAVLGPWWVATPPWVQDLRHVLQPPSWAEPLGTDHLGRSMLARIAHASRLSLGLALLSVVTAAVPGTLIGLAAAWRGGWLDRVLSSAADAVLALPGVLLVLLLSGLAPGAFWPLYVGLSLALWVEYFRVVRATARVVLASPHVESARLLGFGVGYVVRHHVGPALAPAVATLMTFGVATAVLSLSVLGFAGVGVRPPTPELGVMMIELLPYYDEAPWLIAAPIGVLAATVLGLALVSRAARPERPA